mgnify:CR=1 FL=1
MKKIFFIIGLLFAIIIQVDAQSQNNNQNNNQNQKRQPDMQKDTVVLFQGFFGGPIKFDDLLKQDSLTLNKTGLKIVSFKLVYRNGSDTTLNKYESKNNKLTTEMQTAMKLFKPGQNFAFIDVKVSIKGGTPFRPTFDRIEMFVDQEKK